MNVLARHKIAFVAIPKAACSSVKHLFFEFDNGTGFTLVDFYKADYALMADYYTPPELPADAATSAASPPEQHQKRADT